MIREGDVWICIGVILSESLSERPQDARTNFRKNFRSCINRKGEVKMCDYSIYRYLVDSVAKTIDTGCKSYMAPERIDSTGNPEQGKSRI